MNTASTLTDLIKRNSFDEAKQRLSEGEKLPKEQKAIDYATIKGFNEIVELLLN